MRAIEADAKRKTRPPSLFGPYCEKCANKKREEKTAAAAVERKKNTRPSTASKRSALMVGFTGSPFYASPARGKPPSSADPS